MSEEKDFAWLCSLLVSVRAKTPVIETVFFQKEEASLWISTSKGGKVKKKLLSEQSEKSISSVLLHFVAQHLRSSPDPVCTALIKGHRVLIEWSHVDNLASTIALLGRSTAMQATFENKNVYVLRLDMTDSGYDSSFAVRRDGCLENVTSMRLWCKCISVTKVIMKTVERAHKRPVESLELELMVSMEGEVFLYGCTRLTFMRILTTREEYEGKREEIKEDKKSCNREMERKLRFFRIRTPFLSAHNTTAALDLPVSSVTSSMLAVSSEISALQDISAVKMTPKTLSQASGLPKLKRSPTHSFYNPNFKEMLALAYARGQPSKRNLDLETLFKDLDSQVLQDDEPKIRARNSIPTLIKPNPPDIRKKLVPRLIARKRMAGATKSQRSEQPKTRPVHHRSTGSLNSILEKYQPARRLNILISQAILKTGRTSLPGQTYHFTPVRS